jgi:polygalacturonase
MVPILLSSLSLLPVVFAASGSPVSSTDIQGMLCSIETYGKAANWPQSDLTIVQQTLGLTINNFVPQPPTPYVLHCCCRTHKISDSRSIYRTSTSSSASCTITAYADVATAVKTCTDIHLHNITVPAKETLDLSKVKANSVITFEGHTARPFSLLLQ